MDQESIQQLTAAIAVVTGASLAYAKALGQSQSQIVEWLIAAFRVASRWRGLLNLATGVVLAVALSAVAAISVGDWRIVGTGLLAGVLASVEASRAHDAAAAGVTTPEVEAPPAKPPELSPAQRYFVSLEQMRGMDSRR